MTVGKFCTRDVYVCHETESVQDVAQRMSEHNVGSLVVVDDGDTPVGVITDRDLVVDVLAKGTDPAAKVIDILLLKPIVVEESTPLEDAIKTMRQHVCRRLPVVNRAGKLVGILTTDDIVELLAEEMSDLSSVLQRQTNPKISHLAL